MVCLPSLCLAFEEKGGVVGFAKGLLCLDLMYVILWNCWYSATVLFFLAVIAAKRIIHQIFFFGLYHATLVLCDHQWNCGMPGTVVRCSASVFCCREIVERYSNVLFSVSSCE